MVILASVVFISGTFATYSVNDTVSSTYSVTSSVGAYAEESVLFKGSCEISSQAVNSAAIDIITAAVIIFFMIFLI